MVSTKVTFVSCIVEIYDKPVNKSIEKRIQEFKYIADTGSQICLYVCGKTKELMEDFLKNGDYSNIKLINHDDLKDNMEIYNTCMREPVSLPVNRNIEKDTMEYITLMHSKLDYMKHTIDENPFKTDVFAWLDFNLTHIASNIQEKQYIQKYIRQISQIENTNIIIPGCWNKLDQEEYILDNIHWRFCGGFFIGNREHVLKFYELHLEKLNEYLRTYKKLPWEVNIWAYLEYKHDWRPDWFQGDHNFRMVEVKPDIVSKQLEPYSSVRKHSFPEVYQYYPSSTSHILYKGKEIINTRYVNYYLTDKAFYIINHDENHIYTKNMMSIIDENTGSPIEFQEMVVPDNSELVCHGGSIYGLEDIRLFVENDKLRFIATNLNYSPTKRNNMIVGDYNIETYKLENPTIIYSPDPPNSTCEKNWIPLPYNHEDQTQYYIFKWNPLEIGKIENERLKIVKTYENREPFLNRCRGSTIFHETNEGYLGVVHFCEEGYPRNYYHNLVLLDKSYKPLKYSQNCYFHKKSVEFCIGFHIKNDKYHFWISNFDREPEEVIVDKSAFNVWFDIL